RYALGVAALTLALGSAWWCGVQIRRRVLPAWQGAMARLAEAVIAMAEIVAVEEALGAVGLFRRGPVLFTVVVVAAGLGLLARRGLDTTSPLRQSAADDAIGRVPTNAMATAAAA